MKLAAAFGALSSKSSISMSPFSVAMVARVMVRLLRSSGRWRRSWGWARWRRSWGWARWRWSWLGDRHVGHDDRVRRDLDAAGRSGDLVGAVHAGRDSADDRVVVRGGKRGHCAVVEHDEELRTLRVGLGRAGHRDDSATVCRRDRLVLDRIAGIALADVRGVDVRDATVLPISALDHEPGHDSMEHDPVVEATRGQRHEVAGGDR